MGDEAMKDIISFGNKVVPTTWMTSDDGVLPMELAVVPAAYVVFLQQFLVVSSDLTPVDSPHQNHHTSPCARLCRGLRLRSRLERVQGSVWYRYYRQGCLDRDERRRCKRRGT